MPPTRLFTGSLSGSYGTSWPKKDLICFDRFDLAELDGMSAARSLAIKLIRRLPPLRVAAYLLVAGTIVVGAKGIDATARQG